MYIIQKKVSKQKYYWSKRKFMWVGIINNSECFKTEKDAKRYFKTYEKMFVSCEAEVVKVLNDVLFFEYRK